MDGRGRRFEVVMCTSGVSGAGFSAAEIKPKSEWRDLAELNHSFTSHKHELRFYRPDNGGESTESSLSSLLFRHAQS
jgi:N-acetyl-gamma-glutamylphosphate reductase